MTLEELIKVADGAYPDGLVARAHKGEDVGDTLATFIARELSDTYGPSASDEEQLAEAARVMGNAHREIGEVLEALNAESRRVEKLAAAE
jgi:hypothetical protein